MTITKTSSKVCVVGAGPVGLFTTLLLAQAGIDVAVFEREDAIVNSPRAMGYFNVMQAKFKKVGILDEIREAGLVNSQGLKWRRPYNRGILASLPGGPDPSYYPI
ncbi:hypothetical protein BJY00DRAFT_314706 [Aspergillus carlsbadensis]|nr:hypothetical protein BJY00DRAFT_314706 [Aspergillus carlsbadensis]